MSDKEEIHVINEVINLLDNLIEYSNINHKEILDKAKNKLENLKGNKNNEDS